MATRGTQGHARSKWEKERGNREGMERQTDKEGGGRRRRREREEEKNRKGERKERTENWRGRGMSLRRAGHVASERRLPTPGQLPPTRPAVPREGERERIREAGPPSSTCFPPPSSPSSPCRRRSSSPFPLNSTRPRPRLLLRKTKEAKRGARDVEQERREEEKTGWRMRKDSLLVPVQRRGEQPHAEGASKAGHESAGMRGCAESRKPRIFALPSPSPASSPNTLFSHGRVAVRRETSGNVRVTPGGARCNERFSSRSRCKRRRKRIPRSRRTGSIIIHRALLTYIISRSLTA